MSWTRGGGRRRSSCAPPVLVSEAPVLHESALCSGGTAMKGSPLENLKPFVNAHNYYNWASATNGEVVCYTASIIQLKCNFLLQDTGRIIPSCLLENIFLKGQKLVLKALILCSEIHSFTVTQHQQLSGVYQTLYLYQRRSVSLKREACFTLWEGDVSRFLVLFMNHSKIWRHVLSVKQSAVPVQAKT